MSSNQRGFVTLGGPIIVIVVGVVLVIILTGGNPIKDLTNWLSSIKLWKP